ncbi:MAG: sugar transferase [Chthoniobacteraceae bacterium]|nr:sugar transferase [Chthoniobacteraceae bacterium]
MTGRKQEFNLQLYQILDALLLAVAFWAAYVVRQQSRHWFPLESLGPFSDNQWIIFIIMPFGPILLELHGFYVNPLQKKIGRSLAQMASAAFWLALLVAGCVVFFRLTVPSRAVLPFFGFFAALFLTLRERATVAIYRGRTRNGTHREPILLAGRPSDIKALRQALTPAQLIETDIMGEINIETQPVSALIDAMHKYSVNRVIFAGGHSNMLRLQQAIGACEIEGVEAWMVANFIRTSIAKPTFDAMGNVPMLVFRTTPSVSWSLLLKSLVDRLGAAVLLILTSPLMLAAALIIKLTSPGPVVFRQERAGKNGRPFTMYKFRSMITDAEMHRAELESLNQMSGPVFKVDKDPRVTPFGRWIRRTSVDELPQLLNVIVGDMSLVGPRPLPLYEVANFENAAQRRRLSVKPGLTCLWQISGRNDVQSFDQWVKLDLEYIDNWSVWLDLKILFRTIPAVLFGSGAR